MKMRTSNPIRKWRSWFAVVCFGPGALLLPADLTARDVASCSAGVEMHLSPPESSQGTLLLVDVKSAKPLAEITGDWGGRSAPFWQEAGAETPHRALLGIDLEKAPGAYELKVTGQTASGEKVTCSAEVEVKQGRFATERLTVGKQFVEPSPEQIKRADQERQKLRDIFERVTPQRLWDGLFRVPLDGVTEGSNFGKRRILNGNPGSRHGGADLRGTMGTPVHAAQRGRVVLAEELFFAGNTVVIDHGLGIYTFYGHLSEIGVKVDEVLEVGAVLGKVGATGRVTGPHLHWGLTIGKARVNPLLITKLQGP